MRRMHGKGAVKVGDTLYGFYHGFHKGYQKYKEVEITKIGNKYFYGHYQQKMEISFDMRSYPQYYDELARDADGYRYYKTTEAAKRALSAKNIAIELNRRNFILEDDKVILKIGEILGIVNP